MTKREVKINKCGCKLERDRYGIMTLEYCPKHKAAPDMYEALKVISIMYEQGNFKNDVLKQALRAINKAEGR